MYCGIMCGESVLPIYHSVSLKWMTKSVPCIGFVAAAVVFQAIILKADRNLSRGLPILALFSQGQSLSSRLAELVSNHDRLTALCDNLIALR